MNKLLSNNRQLIETLTQMGVIDPHWIRDLEMYEEFQALNTNCVMCKYTIIAEKHGLSEESVRKIIKNLRG